MLRKITKKIAIAKTQFEQVLINPIKIQLKSKVQ